ncbi:chitinase-like protein Idgf5 [Ixodes scapularis]|uniref:chitinase-like protein Idgf5 n=1 Tax=Ixodes scapularis TaxID=6945 RepID=UPI001C392D4F|nr:chitinase-like protein Idgf5 [Ixodes scapularis]
MSKHKENSTLHFLIIYDDHQLLKTKAEYFYHKYLKRNGSGIAAFDVEYDDFANLCGQGKFKRLKAIKDVVATKA